MCMHTYVHGDMYTGFVVGVVFHHMYSHIARRKDFKAGDSRRLEKREPCSAPAGPCGPCGPRAKAGAQA